MKGCMNFNYKEHMISFIRTKLCFRQRKVDVTKIFIFAQSNVWIIITYKELCRDQKYLSRNTKVSLVFCLFLRQPNNVRLLV